MPSNASDKPIYIRELADILNREPGTIRKWERTKVLPQKLRSKRGPRNWRYWTRAQVYGKGGLVEWAKKRDERLGWKGVLGTPYTEEQKAKHVRNLRKPKYLDTQTLTGAKAMADAGKSSLQIITKLFPRVKYANEINFEKALIKEFKRRGWTYPQKDRLTTELQRQEYRERNPRKRSRKKSTTRQEVK